MKKQDRRYYSKVESTVVALESLLADMHERRPAHYTGPSWAEADVKTTIVALRDVMKDLNNDQP